MAQAPPPKIKAFLGTIKEKIFDLPAEGIDLETCYFTLICMEILQRGVIFDPVTDCTAAKILQAVNSVAGKELSNEENCKIPKPLLAGSSVLAARACENTCKVFQLKQSRDNNPLGNIFSKEKDDFQSTIKRCRDVQESRLEAILNLSKVRPDDMNFEENLRKIFVPHQLLTMAEGYYFRAASFQPDAPPMWKRAWDVTEERSNLRAENSTTSTPWMASNALSNLIRIAAAKNNDKRVAELSLRLIESYLGNLDDTANNQKLEDQSVLKPFIGSHRPVMPLAHEKAAKLAQDSLQKLNKILNAKSPSDVLSEQDVFFSNILQVRVYTMQEESEIRKAAEDYFNKSQNRAADSSSKKATTSTKKGKSMEVCLKECRAAHLVENNNSDNPLDISALCLRDELLKCCTTKLGNRDAATQNYFRQGCALIRSYISRLQEQSRALSLAKTDKQHNDSWSKVSDFAIPIFLGIQQEIDLNDNQAIEGWIASMVAPEQILMLEAAAMELVLSEWMSCCGDTNKVKNCLRCDTLKLISDVLNILCKRRSEEEKNNEASNIIASSKEDSTVLQKLECALASSRALLALQIDPVSARKDENNFIIEIMNRSTARFQKWNEGYDELAGELGFSFFEFLICWSGFHRSPWPFCTLPEARQLVLKARAALVSAKDHWGRNVTELEEVILGLGEADTEGGYFDGGLSSLAAAKYNQIIGNCSSASNDVVMNFLVARSYSGLSKLMLRDPSILSNENSVEGNARKSLDLFHSIDVESCNRPFFLWKSETTFALSVRIQIATSRQIIADALLRNGNVAQAQSFLEDAVKDAPLDSSASFALGALLLHLMFFGEEKSPENDRQAQIQLLKAAKMDSTKGSPFALLGYWFEYKKDMKRAVGCYSKALMLDPSHPVAGRGVIRLALPETVKNVFDKAIGTGSALSGWAWRAIGKEKSCNGDDELASVAFIKALRCRDIERQESEPLSSFFADPVSPKLPSRKEVASTLSDLATSYRRLGRFTAALRSYHKAIDESGGLIESPLLCSCAQVEMELGLYDEAEEKFSKAIAIGGSEFRTVAVYGRGLTLLEMARRDAEDGKAGSAFSLLNRAVSGCHILDSESPKHGCIHKLLGDLHTFGAMLPASTFGEEFDDVDCLKLSEELIRLQISFISQGEKAYRTAEHLLERNSDDEDFLVLKASLIADIGSNLLLQAQILSFWEGRGLESNYSTEVSKLLEKAASEFRRSIDTFPTFAAAWCGLGCAVVDNEPLLAQHAFCRCLELDNLLPDAYANLSILYTTHQLFAHSVRISEALTEVADTPLMWINRALILEMKAASNPSKDSSIDDIQQASDAYRAALQVTKHPSAILGLAMTCRTTKQDKRGASESSMEPTARRESHFQFTEYLGLMGNADRPSYVFDGLSALEEGLADDPSVIGINKIRNQLLEDGIQQFSKGLHWLDQEIMLQSPTGNMNRALMHKVLDECTILNNSSGHITNADSAGERPVQWSLQRQIVHEPNRGDLWVKMTKQLAMKIMEDGMKPQHQELQPALAAVRKAVSILMQQLYNVGANKDVYHRVNAADLSDALALLYWIEGSTKHGNDVEDEKKDDAVPQSNAVDLQRALLVNPGNLFAREALKAATEKE